MPTANPLDREILRLAWPTLAALVAEPLFLLVDTALVGHLGGTPLAGLGIASTIIQTAVGLLVFLAYATTPVVARLIGSANRAAAIRAGIDGIWLALMVGVVLLVVGIFVTNAAVGLFSANAAVASQASSYLSISLFGLPAMLLVLAATGLLRGLQNTRTPLVIVTIGFAANALLNVLFIYGFGWGIAGSATGTVVAQWGMAVIFVVRIATIARASGARLRPGLGGIRAAATSGSWLLLRTAALRLAMVATVYAASRLGVTDLAVLQVALAIFSLLAFVLDSLAIAGQSLIGHGLGAFERSRVFAITRRLVRFAILAGCALGAIIVLVSPIIGYAFSSDGRVISALVPIVLIMGIGVPLAGYVFVLDGILIGAGDGRYLAFSGIINVVVYLPLLFLAVELDSLVALWTAFSFGYIGARAITLGLRVRGDRWMDAASVGPTAA